MRILRSSAFAILLALVFSSLPQARPQDPVDAATFALAFRDGKADQYKGRTIAGTAVQFGVSAPVAMLTVGAVGSEQVVPITTNEEFRAAQAAHTTLVIMVSSPDYDPRAVDPRNPTTYAFTGVYNGHMRTAMRPQSPNGAPDFGPCPPQPDDPPHLTGHAFGGPATEYCVPLLDSGTLKKK